MRELKSIYQVVEVIRQEVNKDLPIQQLALFLLVAERPGITMTEMCRVLRMPQGSVSRNVKQLGLYLDQRGGRSVPRGLDLLRTEPDPENRCRLSVYLTKRGQLLADTFRELNESAVYRTPANYSGATMGGLSSYQ